MPYLSTGAQSIAKVLEPITGNKIELFEIVRSYCPKNGALDSHQTAEKHLFRT